PNLLAHGALATPDIYFTAAVMGFVWEWHAFIRAPRFWSSLMLGTTIGAANVFKLTGSLLFALCPVIVLCLRFRQSNGGANGDSVNIDGKIWLWVTLALAFALVVINTGYVFDGFG